MSALLAHKAGHDVSGLMAVLDRAARAKGEDRAVALQQVREFMRRGR